METSQTISFRVTPLDFAEALSFLKGGTNLPFPFRGTVLEVQLFMEWRSILRMRIGTHPGVGPPAWLQAAPGATCPDPISLVDGSITNVARYENEDNGQPVVELFVDSLNSIRVNLEPTKELPGGPPRKGKRFTAMGSLWGELNDVRASALAPVKGEIVDILAIRSGYHAKWPAAIFTIANRPRGRPLFPLDFQKTNTKIARSARR